MAIYNSACTYAGVCNTIRNANKRERVDEKNKIKIYSILFDAITSV